MLGVFCPFRPCRLDWYYSRTDRPTDIPYLLLLTPVFISAAKHLTRKWNDVAVLVQKREGERKRRREEKKVVPEGEDLLSHI